MSLETPRSSAGLTTPRTFQEVFYNYDFHDNQVFLDTYTSDEDDDVSSYQSSFESEVIYNDDMKLRIISKLINVCSDCDKCERETISRLSVIERKFAEESLANYRQMQLMVEYEKKIRDWFAEKNAIIEKLQFKKNNAEIGRLALEEKLETVTNHLSNLENSFNDVHKKYERAKNTMQVLNYNVETLKNSLKEYEECMKQKHEQFEQLKEHALERLNQANLQLDLVEKNFFLEQSKLRTSMNDSEIKVQKLTEELEQKNRTNAELIR